MSKIEPALTPEGWMYGYDSEDLVVRLRNSMSTPGHRVHVEVKAYPLGGGAGNPQDLHALAALCLHGQPFGFTRDDVDFLRSFSAYTDDIAEGPMLAALADRIEALLPPEGV